MNYTFRARESKMVWRMAQWASSATVLIGLGALIGSLAALLGNNSIQHYFPLGLDASIAFLCFGIFLYQQIDKGWHGVLYWLAPGVILILTIYELFIFLWSLVNLNFSFLHPFLGQNNEQAGLSSPISALLFFYSGLTILYGYFGHKRRGSMHLVAACGSVVFIFGFANLIGFWFRSPIQYISGVYPPSNITSLAFLLLGSALIALSGPESFIMRQVSGHHVSARLMRIFLPMVTILVLLQSALLSAVDLQKIIDHPLAITLITLLFVLITGMVVLQASRWVARDIAQAENDQHRAEEALRSNEVRFRMLYQEAPLGYQSLDMHGNLAEVNPAWLNTLGYEKNEVLGRAFCDFLTPESAARFPDCFAKFKQLGEIHNIELNAVRKDGQVLAVSFDAKISYDSQGTAQQSHWIFTDITARQKAEQALHVSQNHLSLIFNHTTDLMALMAVHEDGVFQVEAINEAYHKKTGIYKLPTQNMDLVGGKIEGVIPLVDQMPPEFQEEFLYQIQRVIREGQPLKYEQVFALADGQYITENHVTPILDEKGLCTHVLFVSHDITELRKAEQQVQTQLQRMAGLRSIDTAIAANLDLELVFNLLLEQATQQLGADCADLLLFNPQSNRFEIAARRGFRTSLPGQIMLRPLEGLAGRVSQTNKLVRVSPILLADDPQRAPWFKRENLNTYFGTSLVVKGQLRGVLELFYREVIEKPEAHWLDYMETLAGQAAIALDNSGLFRNLQRANLELTYAYDATIQGWAQALELRDPSPNGQAQNIANLTIQFARELGISDQELVHIRRGALLHDIGLIAVNDDILMKTTPLSDDEWVILKKHPENAQALLSKIHFLKPAVDIPYCHHEHWDGAGYPRGLKADEIPLAARIFAVTDTWGSLTTDRPYRPAWTREAALQYIQSQSGKMFDPKIVQVFSRWINSQQGM